MEKKRNYLIDVFRIIATIGVIGIHVANSTKGAESFGAFFSPLCVSFFFTVSLIYFVSTANSFPPNQVIYKIFTRLIVPLLSWTFVYLILLFIKRNLTNRPVDIVPWRAFLYGESAVQLYFLPHLIMMQFLMLAIHLIINQAKRKVVLSIALICLVIFFFLLGYLNKILTFYWAYSSYNIHNCCLRTFIYN